MENTTNYSKEKNARLCVVMVGLPARGKSFIAQKITKYLSWLGIHCRYFGHSDYRRSNLGVVHPHAEFYDFDDKKATAIRKRALELALQDIVSWFDEKQVDNHVAVLDGTNCSRRRRQWIIRYCERHNISPMFLESWCDRPDIIKENIEDIIRTSPDYEGRDIDEAREDFLSKLHKFEDIYETMDRRIDENVTFVKMINESQRIILNRIETYLESRIVFYVMNLRIKPKCIWLSRHGESIYNVEQKIGGDSSLSERGLKYAKKLKELIERNAEGAELSVWTSTLKRTNETAQFLDFKKIQWKALDELDAGVCDGMTYEEIEREFPEDFKARDEDKYEYRYRGGESYRDIVNRLEPVIMELERQENILIITHQAVLRCLYAYFMSVPQEESPWMSIPLHTLIKLEPRAFCTKVQRIQAHIPAVSTYKEKGTSHVGESASPSTGPRNLLVGSPEISQSD